MSSCTHDFVRRTASAAMGARSVSGINARSSDETLRGPCKWRTVLPLFLCFFFVFTNCVFSYELASYTNCARVKAALRILRGASTGHVNLGLGWCYFRLKFDQVTKPGCHSRRASCCYYCGGCYLFVLYRKARALSLLLVTGFCIFSSIYRVTV